MRSPGAAVAWPREASAQIYAWRDASGTLVLSDRRLEPDAATYDVPDAPTLRTTRPVATSGSFEPFERLVQQYATRTGIRPDLVRAVIQVESGFNPRATSPKGAMGLMQLMPATARELGLVTTGHAQRGVSSTPSPGPSNLHLSAGTITPDALMADIADGFYVTDLIGMGVNQVTGDYSRGASGFWIENGERTYPVSEVTIAGNLIDLFKALSPANDLEFRFGTNAPTVRVEGLTVGGL